MAQQLEKNAAKKLELVNRNREKTPILSVIFTYLLDIRTIEKLSNCSASYLALSMSIKIIRWLQTVISTVCKHNQFRE